MVWGGGVAADCDLDSAGQCSAATVVCVIDRVAEARLVAESALSGDRLLHVQRVGTVAGRVAAALDLAPWVVEAAWLHDVGYSPAVVVTGFHPLDGAVWLAERGWRSEVVALVARHSGAITEAEERGLADGLQTLPAPHPRDLDVLNFCDLTSGPTGEPMTVDERVAEILDRYPAEDPVHRAVLRSRTELAACVARVKARLALADVDVAVD